MQNLISKIRAFITTGHERTVKIKQNIIASFVIKVMSVLTGFLLVPITLKYLGKEAYGIWLTLYSVVGWIQLFDVGMGQGLRNRLSEAITIDNKVLAKKYISTTYLSVIVLFVTLFIIFAAIHPFIDWSKILNTPAEMNSEVSRLTFFTVALFIVQLILSLLGTILVAHQRPAVKDSFFPLANLLSLMGLLIIVNTSDSSLFLAGVLFAGTPPLIYLLATIYFFSRDYAKLKPSFKFFDIRYLKDLIGLGIKFFLINISVLIIYFTANIIISQVFGPEHVTVYNIAYKYFNLVMVAFLIIINPFWSANTEAYVKGEFNWIRSNARKLVYIWFGIIVLVLCMILISNFVYHIWVSNMVTVPLKLSALMGLYIIVATWCNMWAYFINGIGKIRLQLYYSIIQTVISIPLSLFLARKTNLGAGGVILGTSITLMIGGILLPVQFYKILNKKAKGLWGKE